MSDPHVLDSSALSSDGVSNLDFEDGDSESELAVSEEECWTHLTELVLLSSAADTQEAPHPSLDLDDQT